MALDCDDVAPVIIATLATYIYIYIHKGFLDDLQAQKCPEQNHVRGRGVQIAAW